MYEAQVVALATQLAAADPAVCDRGDLAELVKSSQRLRGWLDAFDARIALQAARLAEAGACEAPAAVLAGDGRRSTKDAEAAVGRAGVCALLPGVHDALAAGQVSSGHADALARVTRELDDAGRSQLKELEATLVESATTSSVEAFERQMRDLGRILAGDDGLARHERLRRQRSLRRWVDRNTGMCHTHLQLDPEADAKISAALDAAITAERAKPDTEQRSFEQLKADAMVGLITGARHRDRRTPEVTVLVDLDTLRHGLHDSSLCETGDGQPLPPDTVRRLCCQASIVPIVLNGHGETLDLGREQRLASRAQRRALRAMYRSCGYPGCTVRFADCEIHHVIDWDHHGPTDLANLLPLCSRHHHLVHEGRWPLTLHPDRSITLTRPDGTVHFEGSTVDVAPTGLPAVEAEIIELARTRARALGPPARAPAA
jgi:Domain of unknown function (DUF222)/HNH endonuclease